MTVDESMAKAAAEIAKQVEHALEAGEMLLRDKGATEDEVAAFMVEHRSQMQQWADETLGEIRRSMSDWSAPSVKLQ